MAHQTDGPSASSPPLQQRRLGYRLQCRLGRGLIVLGALLGLSVPVALVALDQSLDRNSDVLGLRLEQLVSRSLGHPLQLGDYRGLGWRGVRLGPSRLLRGARDDSSVDVAALSAGVDLLASLLQRRWVVDLHLHGATMQLRQNSSGAFWVAGGAGQRRSGQQSARAGPPPLRIRLHPGQGAQLSVWARGHSDLDPPDLSLILRGRLDYISRPNRWEGWGALALSGGEQVSFHSRGSLADRPWQLTLGTEGLNLAQFAAFGLTAGGEPLPGRLQSDLRFSLGGPLQRRCEGSATILSSTTPAAGVPLSPQRLALAPAAERLVLPLAFLGLNPYVLPLDQLGLRPVSLSTKLEALELDRLELHCRGQTLELQQTSYRLGALQGVLDGALRMDGRGSLDLHWDGALPSRRAGIIAGQWNGSLSLDGLQGSGRKLSLRSSLRNWRRNDRFPTWGYGPQEKELPDSDLQLDAELGEELHIERFVLAAGDTRIRAGGTLGRQSDFVLAQFSLAPADWLTPREATPYSDGVVYHAQGHLRGPLRRPTLDLRVGTAADPGSLTLAWHGRGGTLRGSLPMAAGTAISMDGEAAQKRWTLDMDLDGVELGPFFSLLHPRLRAPTELHVSAAGHYDQPRNSGEGRWLGGGITLAHNHLDLRWPEGLEMGYGSLLGPTRAQLQLDGSGLELVDFRAPDVAVRGRLDWPAGSPLRAAGLQLDLDARRLPLDLLGLATGQMLGGHFDYVGEIRGTLAAPRFEADVALNSLRLGRLAWPERWLGTLASGPDAHRLSLSRGSAGLLVELDRDFGLRAMELQRAGGHLTVDTDPASPGRYLWSAQDLPLRPLQLAWRNAGPFRPLSGLLTGRGSLDPGRRRLALDTQVTRPRLGPLGFTTLQLRGSLQPGGFELLSVLGAGDGKVALRTRQSSRDAVDLEARLDAVPAQTIVTAVLLLETLLALPQPGQGSAGELLPVDGSALQIRSVDLPLGAPLNQARARARARLTALDRALGQGKGVDALLDALRGRVDGSLRLAGPVGALQGSADLSGRFWLAAEGLDSTLEVTPWTLRFEGPFVGTGEGSFGFDTVPLALAALLAPGGLPVSGSLQGRGRYRLGGPGGVSASLSLDMVDAELAGRPLSLQEGRISLEGRRLSLDIALLGGEVEELLELRGGLSLDAAAEDLNLRLSSKDEGLGFLLGLGGPALVWQGGSARVFLLLRGSLRQPIANGYLRLTDGTLVVLGQPVRDLDITALFDFDSLYLDRLEADVGNGLISADGYVGLFQPVVDASQPLTVRFSGNRMAWPQAELSVSGALSVGGSLTSPVFGGSLQLSEGALAPGAGGGNGSGADSGASGPDQTQFAGADWMFDAPLVLNAPNPNQAWAERFEAVLPDRGAIRFRDLRLELGPGMRLQSLPLADFAIGGNLLLNGPLDRDLSINGVVKLLSGRLTLFTTSFSLDRDSPNVAVFIPSLGPIPYLDLALQARLATSLGGTPSPDNQPLESERDGFDASSLSFSERLNLVRIRLIVSGQADRLLESIALTSTPPLPERELIGLIGGSAVAEVLAGQATSSVVTALGQTLVDPWINSFVTRPDSPFTFSIYPAYMVPQLDVSAAEERRRLSPELVLGTELGIDIGDSLNLSLLAAPNHREIPLEFSLGWQLDRSYSIQAVMDSESNWKASLEVFFRF